MEQQKLEQFKSKLITEKTRLENDISSIAKKDPDAKDGWQTKFPQFGSHTSEQDENADEVEEYIVDTSIEHNLEERLNDINAALDKIESGKYGKCEICDKEIPFERLGANPEAKTCIEHAK